MIRIHVAAVAIIVFVGLAPTAQVAATSVRFAAASAPVVVQLQGAPGEAARVGCEDAYAFNHRSSATAKPPSARA